MQFWNACFLGDFYIYSTKKMLSKCVVIATIHNHPNVYTREHFLLILNQAQFPEKIKLTS